MKNAPKTAEEIHSQIYNDHLNIKQNAKSYGQDHIINFLNDIRTGCIHGVLTAIEKISPSINADHPLRLAALCEQVQVCALLLQKGATIQGYWSDKMNEVLEKAMCNNTNANTHLHSRLKF